jgi:hypothetical protein
MGHEIGGMLQSVEPGLNPGVRMVREGEAKHLHRRSGDIQIISQSVGGIGEGFRIERRQSFKIGQRLVQVGHRPLDRFSDGFLHVSHEVVSDQRLEHSVTGPVHERVDNSREESDGDLLPVR